MKTSKNKCIFIELDGVLNIQNDIYNSRQDTGVIAEPYQLFLLNDVLNKTKFNIVFLCKDSDDILIELSKLGFNHLDKVQGSIGIDPTEYSDYIKNYSIQNNADVVLIHATKLTSCPGRTISVDPELGLTPKETYVITSKYSNCS
jgi:hypothetical protein